MTTFLKEYLIKISGYTDLGKNLWSCGRLERWFGVPVHFNRCWSRSLTAKCPPISGSLGTVVAGPVSAQVFLITTTGAVRYRNVLTETLSDCPAGRGATELLPASAANSIAFHAPPLAGGVPLSRWLCQNNASCWNKRHMWQTKTSKTRL